MSAATVRSRLSRFDRALIADCADGIEHLAVDAAPGERIASRSEFQGELIDIGARLRTVLIWARATP